MKMRTAHAILALVLMMSAGNVSAQSLKDLTVRVEVSRIHESINNQMDAAHPATMHGVNADYETKNWLFGGRLLQGKDEFDVKKRDMAVRIGHRLGGLWGQFGYGRLESRSRYDFANLVYGDVIVDNGPTPGYYPGRGQQSSFPPVQSQVIATVLVEDYGVRSFEGFEIGLEDHGTRERLFFRGGLEVYPRLTYLDSHMIFEDHKPSGEGTSGGNAVGLRGEGSLGVTLYKELGVEGSFSTGQIYGPTVGGEKHFTVYTTVAVRAVYKFK